MKRLLLFTLLLWPSLALFADDLTPSEDHHISVKIRHEKDSPGRAYAVYMPLPAYPSEMLRVRIDGQAELTFLVTQDGSVTDIKVASATQREFSDPAKEAISRWRFRLKEDLPAPAKMRCWIIFKMEDER